MFEQWRRRCWLKAGRYNVTAGPDGSSCTYWTLKDFQEACKSSKWQMAKVLVGSNIGLNQSRIIVFRILLLELVMHGKCVDVSAEITRQRRTYGATFSVFVVVPVCLQRPP